MCIVYVQLFFITYYVHHPFHYNSFNLFNFPARHITPAAKIPLPTPTAGLESWTSVRRSFLPSGEPGDRQREPVLLEPVQPVGQLYLGQLIQYTLMDLAALSLQFNMGNHYN